VYPNGILEIKDGVGISNSAIWCSDKITIEENVIIGGDCKIYDTDFHSLNKFDRLNSSFDKANTITKPVIIESDVFIGAHSTILKGIRIGSGSIIGACSVVSKSIPANEIWSGNPIKFIRKIYE